MALSAPPRGLRRVLGSTWVRLTAGLLLLGANLVLLNVLATRHHRRSDWTRSRLYSLSPRTRAVLHALRAPVTLILFMVPPERHQESLYDEGRELLARFASEAPLLQIEQLDVDADRTRAELLARRYAVSAEDLRQGVVVAVAGARSKYVTAAEMAEYAVTPEGRRLVAFTGEAALLRAVLTVTSGEPPLVCFLQGHGEAAVGSYEPAGYGRIADEVKRAGFGVREASAAALERGLPGCGIAVLGGPTRSFAALEVDALDRFVRRRGRLLALVGPVLDRRLGHYGRLGLEEWLAGWGARPLTNLVVDPLALPGEQPLLTWAAPSPRDAHPIGRALRNRLTVWPLAREVRPIPGARPGLRAESLVESSKNGWGETDLAALRGDTPLRFDPGRDTAGPVSVAVASEWRESRLVVLGSERGVLNDRLAEGGPRDSNRELVLAALDWLAPGSPVPVEVGPKHPEHVRLILAAPELRRVYLITVVAMPLLALGVGLLVWRRRRR